MAGNHQHTATSSCWQRKSRGASPGWQVEGRLQIFLSLVGRYLKTGIGQVGICWHAAVGAFFSGTSPPKEG